MRQEASDEALEQSRQLNDLIEGFLASAPSVHTVDPAVTRRQRAEGTGAFPAPVRHPSARDDVLAGVPVRVVAREDAAAVYLHLHGGGWTLGAADQQDLLLVAMAERADVAVVSVDYRLAPEHPFPAAPDDCEAVARWLVDHSLQAFGTERLVIGGESAGAHLAALTLVRLRDAGVGTERFAGANLVFGAFDLAGTPSQRLWGERNLILSTPIIEWFTDCFLPGLDADRRRHPSISPLYADLSGLPPALFTVGELDPLLDDSLFMAARWEAAGNRAELAVFPESIHGFTAFPTELASRCYDLQHGFVREVLT